MDRIQLQSQRESLRFSPLQIQLLSLIQLNPISIEQKIKDELIENPALEEGFEDEALENGAAQDSENDETFSETNDFDLTDYFFDDGIPDNKLNGKNSNSYEELFSQGPIQTSTFQEQLKDQLHLLKTSERDKRILDDIVDSLDENGYLRVPLDILANDLSFIESKYISEAEIEKLLPLIQQCDPPGVGCTSLQECLLLQLKRTELNIRSKPQEHAIYLIHHYFIELCNKNYNKILREAGLTEKELKLALKVITHLNPKPVEGSYSNGNVNTTIIPEFTVVNNTDRLDVSLTNQITTSIRLNNEFVDLVENKTLKLKNDYLNSNLDHGIVNRNQRKTIQYLKGKINSAKWFLQAIAQREKTMLKTMQAIVKLQSEFFITGDTKKLKQLILKDVAELIHVDISTASRVTSNKYVQTQFGIMCLKDFFSNSLMRDNGEEVSSKELKSVISELIVNEDKHHPLTDREIKNNLKEKGYLLARRTVAKYRDRLNIPIARLRIQV